MKKHLKILPFLFFICFFLLAEKTYAYNLPYPSTIDWSGNTITIDSVTGCGPLNTNQVCYSEVVLGYCDIDLYGNEKSATINHGYSQCINIVNFDDPPPQTCQDSIVYCTDQTSCEAENYYWYNDTCNSDPYEPPPPTPTSTYCSAEINASDSCYIDNFTLIFKYLETVFSMSIILGIFIGTIIIFV